MSALALTRDQYLELEKIGLGAFAPLAGFMTEDQFRAAVETMRLPDGTPFPVPVVLDVGEDDARRMGGGKRVALAHDGRIVGEVEALSVYTCDKTRVARQVFGTDEMRHPGVKRFVEGGDWFVGGPARLIERARFDVSADELDPAETRALFARRGWRTIAGFQTRNVPHRAHEYLQTAALEEVDGLFIQPLVGRRKAGDFSPQAIMRAYRALIARRMPEGRTLLGILSTAMRYAGPREAVFHALIRRNYGCTHFIVGRDHAGVGGYYGPFEALELVRRFAPELGIAILSYGVPFYCPRCKDVRTARNCPRGGCAVEGRVDISGTDMRAILGQGRVPPPEVMRPEVAAALAQVPPFILESEP